MTSLIVGASGNTGKLLVEQLLDRGENVKAIVRSPENFSEKLKSKENLTLISASVLDLSDNEMLEYVKDCDAVISCLGHNLTFKGLFGHPRKLVTDATRRLCEAIEKSKGAKPVKYILMNTVGNRNLDLDEEISGGQKIIMSLIRLLLPPQVDNEHAANYLRTRVGQDNKFIEWTAVRPDSLIDLDEISEYNIHPSPIRSALFDPGKTSRINVAHFMAELIDNESLWKEWKGKMPVIYNIEEE